MAGRAIYAIGEVLGIPASDVEGVATFYSQIFRVPVGRHIIRVCDSMTCYIGGHESVVGEIQRQRASAWARPPPTAASPCCRSAAWAIATRPGAEIDDDTHGDVQPAGVAKLLEGYA